MTDLVGHPPSYARVSLAIMTSGREANLHGNIHGGEVVKLADSTAGAVAQRHSAGPAVTAALDEMAFLEPIHVGDIVRTFGQVNWAGRSSMEIGVRVEAQPWNDPAAESTAAAKRERGDGNRALVPTARHRARCERPISVGRMSG